MNTAKPVKLIIVGGFLGAGKTTSILALARRLAGQSYRVGLVTNDQGSRLVDTEYLRQSGFPVLEVNGGCFCCNFDQFADRLATLQETEYPDYILAEPVGSCTDLVATLLKPLRQAGRAPVALAPLSVVVDPRRLDRVMMDDDSPFPNEINYLFGKQLEEADLVILNKTDHLDGERIARLTGYLGARYPAAVVLPVSAMDGTGIEDWSDMLLTRDADPGRKSLEIVYDTYASAEESLGWVNCTARMTAPESFDGNLASTMLMEGVREALSMRGEEIAHLKAYLVAGNDFVKQSLVSLGDSLATDHRMSVQTRDATVVLNIRALADPAVLEGIILKNLTTVAAHFEATLSTPVSEAFRPSYPKPVHRIS